MQDTQCSLTHLYDLVSLCFLLTALLGENGGRRGSHAPLVRGRRSGYDVVVAEH